MNLVLGHQGAVMSNAEALHASHRGPHGSSAALAGLGSAANASRFTANHRVVTRQHTHAVPDPTPNNIARRAQARSFVARCRLISQR